MKKLVPVLALLLLCLVLTSCQSNQTAAPQAHDEPFAHPTDDKDFSELRTPGSQEEAYTYKNFFLPAVDGISQPYVGDTMPYYENGVYYIYYLKEGGDSFNHSIYLATTEDFITYREYDEPILEREYAFTYVQEGSVGVFYLEDIASLTVRLYGVSGKTIRLFAENNSVAFTELREYTR